MPKFSDAQWESLNARINALHEDLEHVETLEARFDEIMERKLFEVRTLAYVLLLITGVQLALTIGALVRQLTG